MCPSAKPTGETILKPILILIGLLSTALAILGIFLPLLPTVPLLLLAAACFARSSEKFYNRLIENPQLGPIIRDFNEGQGVPLRAKIVAILLIWSTISISALFFISIFWLRAGLFAIAFSVTLYLWRIPTRNP
ncbi:MAG: DUF454 domain-containing protein [Desulfuromonas sp.]|nr:MAG: DUF454 domain-containing protein [Desulfuromonas sp.]